MSISKVERLNAALIRAVKAPISAVLEGEAAKGPVLQEKMSAAEGGLKEPMEGNVRALLVTMPLTVPHCAWVSMLRGWLLKRDQTDCT